MRSIPSGIILVLLALQLAHSATVSDKNTDLAAEGRHAAEFGGENAPYDAFPDVQNDAHQLKNSFGDIMNWPDSDIPGNNGERVRSKRQVDNSETFSDITDTSLNILPLPLKKLDDAVQISDENNDDAEDIDFGKTVDENKDEDYNSLNSNNDAEDFDYGKTVEDKIVKEEPKLMEMKKEIDVSSGSTDIPDSEETESQTDSKVIFVEQAIESEESKVDDKLDMGKSVDESGDVEEHTDQGTKSDENVQSKAIKTEEDSKLVEANVDLSMANDDAMLETGNTSKLEDYEYEDSVEEKYSTEKAATSELIEQVRVASDAEILPSDIKASEASSKADIKEKLENGEGSGDSDEADSFENGSGGSGMDGVEGSGDYKNISVNAQNKNVIGTNPVKSISEIDPLNMDDTSFTSDEDDEPPIEIPEETTIVQNVVVDDKHDPHASEENPISDPTRTVSEPRHIDTVTSVKEGDSKHTEDADNMKLDELIIVPDMTTLKNIEGSASGGINLDDYDGSSEDSEEVPAILNRGVLPVQPAQSPPETKEDPDQSEDVTGPITELSVTGEEVPDSDGSTGVIEESIVPVNVNKVNAIPDESIFEGKTHGNISTDVERDEDMSKTGESINEIGVKTDEKAASTPETEDTSISSGSFIILGAIMVAIVALLGYTVLKSRRQKQLQRDARKAKEDDPGTELKLITPHQNGNGPNNGIAEAERLLSSNGDYDDAKPAAGTQNKYTNGDITAGMDQTIRVNMSPKMANGKSVMSADDHPDQVHNQPMEKPHTDAVAVDLRYVPAAATPNATADVMQSLSGSSCSLNSVDDRGSWVYGTRPLETTKIKMFIDEDSIPKTPIVIEKRGGVTVDV